MSNKKRGWGKKSTLYEIKLFKIRKAGTPFSLKYFHIVAAFPALCLSDFVALFVLRLQVLFFVVKVFRCQINETNIDLKWNKLIPKF